MTPEDFIIIERTLTRALISGDYALFRSLVYLPIVMVPRGGEAYELKTEDELRDDFDLYHQALTIQRATDIYRKILTFSHMEDDWVEVTVETNILGSTGRIVDPFHTQFVLRPQDGTWRIILIRSSFGHITWTRGKGRISPEGRFEDLSGGGGLVPPAVPTQDN
ncbi:MAG: hypothetical protein CML68_20615 [Rhodobacteraceae bacterium]|nr:hypothetical protein [Paracoccaceae bacterium]